MRTITFDLARQEAEDLVDLLEKEPTADYRLEIADDLRARFGMGVRGDKSVNFGKFKSLLEDVTNAAYSVGESKRNTEEEGVAIEKYNAARNALDEFVAGLIRKTNSQSPPEPCATNLQAPAVFPASLLGRCP